ncbi:PREDICTED: tudor domain-containing protein 15 [Crocodylus porosus]|uniref:tudor domain-containing protein 15 n=1 Tax=Crocodylus porosus TaxID=8502 RepID=UPI00093F7045|nr:PREDICTED: tudor domain-containing protein 15 [Crocodylus porosus]XP_019392882.1 PREDICTED: tudor domain-containing protein 15 [Crocodylus porosus]XP_019392883.1 PREDICTED: tudor domain-containing protein 15 [Crocodylus porosus]
MDSLSPSPKFLDVDLMISHVACHPKEILVTFQGKSKTECEFDYHILQNEIQHVCKVKDNIGIGESCLVEDANGEWHRGRVLEKREEVCEVFLVDIGKVLIVNETHISSVSGQLFQLPPKVLYGVFANILPVGEKWCPKAVNYFSSLIGLQIKGHVQAILPYQTFLLEVPKVTSDVLELHLGKLVDGHSFRLIVEMLKESPQGAIDNKLPDLLQQKYTRPDLFSLNNAENLSDFQPVLGNLLLPLTVGSIEKVKVTAPVSPSKFYCQVLKWQKELEDLTAAMHLYYEAISKENIPSCDSFGVLCAAKTQNGQWHRGVIQQLLSANQIKVWFMDFGHSEAVPSNCVRKLKSEFISLPMVSFPCALMCCSDQNEAAMNLQMKEFKQAVVRQTAVYACIDLFSANERLYYVTLQSKEREINAKYLKQEEVAVAVSDSKAVLSTCGENSVSGTNVIGNTEQTGNCIIEKNPLSVQCKMAEMKINSNHVAFVKYVLSPSDFWIQTADCQNEFQTMLKNIAGVYNECGINDRVVENPKPGLLCCARYSKDMQYYRGIITEVVGVNISVFFLDFGNTDTVPFHDVKTLVPEFCELPALALCCELAHASPREDVWVKKETDFFKKMVFNKPLLLHVIAKQNEKYIVNAEFMSDLKQMNVVTLMVQAGYAEYWEKKPNSPLDVVKNPQLPSPQNKNRIYKNAQGMSVTHKKSESASRNTCQNIQLLNILPAANKSFASFLSWESAIFKMHHMVSGRRQSMKTYTEFIFKPGTVIDVVCSYINSPGDFSCQLRSKLPELMNLMEQIQNHYEVHSSPYTAGQIACVAKHSKDGKWYRASIVKQISKTEVDVIFVDYGNRERVLVKDLQGIHPYFLSLESQAFRCSIKNVSEFSQFDPFVWTEKACRDFENFTSASCGQLTCIIYALILISPNCLCNVVDLKTPFISTRQFFTEPECVPSLLTKELGPLFFLYSFCYSSFDVKIGSEEEVYLTHVRSPSKFYCQLNRNADIIDALMLKTAEISKMPRSPKYDSSNIRLCIAKYFEDGLFYRALASAVGLSSYSMVYFVDFGNKQMVEREKLIPIPNNAVDVLFTPMQAIKCYLPDLVEREIPIEVSRWFEDSFMGKLLKAVVVSRESDGQIGLELYDGNLQINKRIKEMLSEYVKKYTRESGRALSCTEQFAANSKMLRTQFNEANVTSIERESLKTETKKQVYGTTSQPDFKQGCEAKEQDVLTVQKNAPLKLSTFNGSEELGSENIVNLPVQHRRKSTDKKFTSKLLHGSAVCMGETTADDMPETNTNKLNYTGKEKSSRISFPKCINLPPRNIQANSKLPGYISNLNSLSSFYIHLADDENLLIQLAEELNKGAINTDYELCLNQFVAGDLVIAEYAVDCSLYRAAIKAVRSKESFEVEFIDYGNTAVVNSSKIYRIQTKFLTLPKLSIHCFLSRLKSSSPDRTWSSELMFYFAREVINKPIICVFLQDHEQKWEVDILCDGKSMANDLLEREGSSGLQKTQVLDVEMRTKENSVGTNVDSEESPVRRKISEDANKHKAEKHLCFLETPRNTSENLSKIPSQDLNAGQLEIAEIINVSKCGNFCIKLIRNAKTLSHLKIMIAKEVKKKCLLATENIKEGLEYLTKSKRTLSWYRSEVIKKVESEKKLFVFFVDCGRCEMVSWHNTKMLSDEIRSIPKQVVSCKWVWVKNSGKIPFDHVVQTVAHREIKILFLRYLESSCIWEVEILIDGILLLEHLNQISSQDKSKELNCSECASNVHSMMSFRINSVTWSLLQSGNQYRGFAATVTDPSNFCVQLEDLFDTMKTLFMLLSDLPDNLPALPQEFVTPGVSCLIKLELEAQWNRVEVTEVLNHSILLTFIDYGFLKYIPYSDIHKLKIIPDELACLPRLTYSCFLSGVNPAKGNDWSDEAKLLSQEFLSKGGLIFQFKQYGFGMKLEVDVLCEQRSLADILVGAGFAVYTRSKNCFVAPHTKSEKAGSQSKCESQHSLLQLSERKLGCRENIVLPVEEENSQQQILDLHDNKDHCTVSRRNSTKPHAGKQLRKKPKSNNNDKSSAKDELNTDKNKHRQHCDMKCKVNGTERITQKKSPESLRETYETSDLDTRMGVMKIREEMPSN